MTEDLLLSVTVLSYNNGQYITECLQSIERQDIDSYEVIIVDDCSTDRSVEIIEDFIKDRPQYTLVQKEENSGGAISSQIGIARSKGKYCSIIDSDDIVADGAYKKLISRIEKDGSDFAAGMPVILKSGCFFKYLPTHRELDLFSCSRVLEGVDKIRYSNQVYYWNSVFRTEFIKANNIKMPEGLLIADRVFMFSALYKAKRISVENSIVYYWRQQKNQNKPSITEVDRNYPGMADRCDSYDSQLRVLLENSETDSDMNLKIWENSFERLFVPFTHALNAETIDEELLRKEFDRYRLLMCEYPAFFMQLAAGGNISALHTYYTVNILEDRFEDILHIAGFKKDVRTLNAILAERGNDIVKQAILRESDNFSVLRIEKEGSKLFLYVQKPKLFNSEIHIDKIAAISSCYRMKQFDLKYDNINERAEISGLPEASYEFMVSFSVNSESSVRPVKKDPLAEGRVLYEDENCCISSSKKGGNPFRIFKKNRYTFADSNNDILIYINQQSDDISDLFFYNVSSNTEYRLEKAGKNLYRLELRRLSSGRNILIAEHGNGIFAPVDKRQFSNSYLQMMNKDYLFKANLLETTVDSDKGGAA